MFYKYPKWFSFAIIGFLIIITLIAYFKVLSADFVYDDIGFIVNNKAIQSFTPFSKFFTDPNIFTGSEGVDDARNWRPIASLAFAIEYKLFGANPFGFHLVSILFHLINTILVYFLIRKMTNNFFVAFFVTSLWALHPVLTEAVSWVSNQSSLIFFTFFLLSVLSLLRYKENQDKKFFLWFSYLFFAVSLLAKETTLGGIFVIWMVFLYYFNFKKHFKLFSLFLIIGATYLFARYQILGSLGDHAYRGSFLENLLLAPAVFLKYLTLAVWPANLLLDYSNYPLPMGFLDFRVIFGILFFIIFGLLIWLGLKKSLFPVSLGIIWFIAFLLPVLQVIPFQDIVGERFLYAPMLGFFLSAVSLFTYASNSIKSKINFNFNAAGIVLLLIILVFFIVLTFNRNTDWLNSENLWLSVLKIDASNSRALQNLSAFYLQKGEALKIIEFSKRLIEVDPENKAGHLHLSVGKILNGEYKEAESELLDLIKKHPDFEEAKINLLVLYKQLGGMSPKADPFVESVIISPEVEGNVITSGMFGKIVLNGAPYEASLDVLSGERTPVISIRSRDDGSFQIPLRPGRYILRPSDPDGPIKPVRNDYSFVVSSGEWLQVKIEYK